MRDFIRQFRLLEPLHEARGEAVVVVGVGVGDEQVVRLLVGDLRRVGRGAVAGGVAGAKPIPATSTACAVSTGCWRTEASKVASPPKTASTSAFCVVPYWRRWSRIRAETPARGGIHRAGILMRIWDGMTFGQRLRATLRACASPLPSRILARPSSREPDERRRGRASTAVPAL